MSKCFIIISCISSILFSATAASGDGCMMPLKREIGKSTKMVASPKQEALLATDGKTVQIVLRTHFRAGPEELAWIVPVPSKPIKIEKCSDEIFSALERETAPKFYRESGKGGGGFGCGCANFSPMAASMAKRSSVVIEQTGTAGIFKYVVLSATKADELTKWLNDNKYFVPIGAERIFDKYVKGGWYFLAMRIRPEAADALTFTLAPHPISYTYRDNKLIYPLIISQLSADLRNEIVLYVVGNCRYGCANWANATIDPEKIELEPGSPSGTNYEELVTALTEKHQGRLFVTELAGRADVFTGRIGNVLDRRLTDSMGVGRTITRLRAIMTPGAMDRDVMLIPLAGWEKVDNIYHLTANDPPDVPVAAACGLAFAAFMGIRLTGRSHFPRRV